MILGVIPLAAGLLLSARWLFLYWSVGAGRSHVPSLIAAAVLAILGALFWLCALLGELVGINRRLLEDTQYQLRRNRLDARRRIHGREARCGLMRCMRHSLGEPSSRFRSC